MSTNKAKGECPDKTRLCTYDGYKKVRYFNGMLMTVKDFSDEQDYLVNKRKLHNRMLHGWGVVCGLKIEPGIHGNKKIVVRPGLALDCCGNEIYVPGEVEIDLEKMITQAKQAEGECEGANGYTWYVVIKYDDVPTDPVPVYLQSDTCEKKSCDRTRVAEGYCFYLTKDRPCPVPPKKKAEGKEVEAREVSGDICDLLLTPCPDCCDDKGVVLGSISYEGELSKVTGDMINNWDCRRYVITFGMIQHWASVLGPDDALKLLSQYPTVLGERCQRKKRNIDAREVARLNALKAAERKRTPKVPGRK